MNKQDKLNFIKSYRRYLELSMNFSLASLPEGKIPDFELANDTGCWTDHKTLHIGIEDANVETDEDLMIWTMFRLGHECQHILSTTNKSWDYALTEGFHIICRALSKKIDKVPRLFRKDIDYDNLLEDAKKQGYNLSTDSIQHFVHFIINSVEDGRIERIRSLKRPGFKNYMIICRGGDWEDNPIPDEMVETISEPYSYLCIVLNQILTLSTMSIYQKGFTRVALDNDVMHKLVLDSIPYIRQGVNSTNCRKCMEECLKIVELLADEIIEASKKTPLEELIDELFKMIMDGVSFDMKDYSYSDSRTEETGDDVVGLTFEPFGSDMDEKGENSGSDGAKGTNIDSDNGDDAPKSEPSSDFSDVSSAISSAKGSVSGNMDATIKSARSSCDPDIENSLKSGYKDKKKESKDNVVNEGRDEAVTDVSETNGFYSYSVDFVEEKRGYTPDMQMPVELNGMAKTLKRKVEKIFKNQESPLIRGQKAGSLDVANLYKLPLGQVDLFQKKALDNEFDGCCYLLMDNSGSMGNGKGSKRYHCCRALAVLEEAFQNIMPLKITAFDAYGSRKVHHQVIKNWSEKITHNGSYNYYEHESSGLGNKDGYSIRVATEELLKRSEQKKILIVLSDGLPSDYESGEKPESDVYDAVKRARSLGIEVIGIYFGSNLKETNADVKTFRAMYDSGHCGSIITEPENISNELIRILKRFCFR